MFALGLLATAAVSESSGGYLVVRIVVENGALKNETPGVFDPGWVDPSVRGSGPMFGGPPPGGPGPMGSFGGPPKGVGGPPPGIGSAGGPPKGMGGPPPGMGSAGGPPKGMGGPPPGGPGPGGLAGGGIGSFTPGTVSGEVVHDPSRSIYVVIPYTNDITKDQPFYTKAPQGSWNPHWQPSVKHPFGRANLLMDNTQIQLYLNINGPQVPTGMKTRQTEIAVRHLKWLKTPTDGQALFDLMNDALEQGFVTDAVKFAAELATAAAEKKLQTSPPVEKFLKAYAQVKDGMTKPARSPSDGATWRERISFAYPGVKDYISPHYHILFWEGMDPEAMRRVAQLEENFKAFYLVNAVHGQVMPIPDKPLLVILAKSTTDVRRLAASLDAIDFVSDGFFAPDHNIVVLSPERMDAVSQSFSRQIQEMFRQGASREQLLAGEGPKIDDKGLVKDSRKSEDVARMQTMVVVERYAEEEGEWSAVSREGTRQLLHATGQLPQHVSLPLWLSNGSAAYWQRPKGPVFSREGDHDIITIALSTGYGGPNYVRQKQFMDLVRRNQFSANAKQKADPGQVLQNVITDAYFRAIHTGLDIDDPKLPPAPTPKKPAGANSGPPAAGAPAIVEDPNVVKRRRYEFLQAKAQSTAWSLYFYLARVNPVGLEAYVSELRRMPRDWPLDEHTRLTIFAKAFNLTLDGKKTTGQMTLGELGAGWFQFLETVPQAGIDVPLADLAEGGAGAAPGAPGAPPGAPGAPPGIPGQPGVPGKPGGRG
jgi:hypothetical protein